MPTRRSCALTRVSWSSAVILPISSIASCSLPSSCWYTSPWLVRQVITAMPPLSGQPRMVGGRPSGPGALIISISVTPQHDQHSRYPPRLSFNHGCWPAMPVAQRARRQQAAWRFESTLVNRLKGCLHSLIKRGQPTRATSTTRTLGRPRAGRRDADRWAGSRVAADLAGDLRRPGFGACLGERELLVVGDSGGEALRHPGHHLRHLGVPASHGVTAAGEDDQRNVRLVQLQ